MGIQLGDAVPDLVSTSPGMNMRQVAFLVCISKGMTVRAACATIRAGYAWPYETAREDAEFAAAWAALKPPRYTTDPGRRRKPVKRPQKNDRRKRLLELFHQEPTRPWSRAALAGELGLGIDDIRIPLIRLVTAGKVVAHREQISAGRGKTWRFVYIAAGAP